MSQLAILDLLKWRNYTVPELTAALGISEESVRRSILRLRFTKRIHIDHWQKPPLGRCAAVWTLGPGEDAPYPAPPKKHKHGRPIASTKREDATILAARQKGKDLLDIFSK